MYKDMKVKIVVEIVRITGGVVIGYPNMGEYRVKAGLGEIMRSLRLRQYIFPREAERASGVSDAYVSQIERGARARPSTEILIKMEGRLRGCSERVPHDGGSKESVHDIPRGCLVCRRSDDYVQLMIDMEDTFKTKNITRRKR